MRSSLSHWAEHTGEAGRSAVWGGVLCCLLWQGGSGCDGMCCFMATALCANHTQPASQLKSTLWV
jgi:hypothetical protein